MSILTQRQTLTIMALFVCMDSIRHNTHIQYIVQTTQNHQMLAIINHCSCEYDVGIKTKYVFCKEAAVVLWKSVITFYLEHEIKFGDDNFKLACFFCRVFRVNGFMAEVSSQLWLSKY